jgi:hypothetical protein
VGATIRCVGMYIHITGQTLRARAEHADLVSAEDSKLRPEVKGGVGQQTGLVGQKEKVLQVGDKYIRCIFSASSGRL